jgi:uncharacterized protein (DUF1501 family)
MALNGTPRAASGFLPVAHAPFLLTSGEGLPNTAHPDGPDRYSSRMALLQDSERTSSIQAADLGSAGLEMAEWKLRSQLLMYNSNVDKIFLLNGADQRRYGNSAFGNACLTARNLLNAKLGTRFIQITFGSWDHHAGIYGRLVPMATDFDSGLAALMTDLKSNGLFDETLIVAQGEFGRSVGPLNGGQGRDHYPQQTVLFAGAGTRGGRAIGSTDDMGAATADPGWSRGRDVRAEDIEATIYSALGIDWTKLLRDNRFGRGYEYVPSASGSEDIYGPVNELWG